MVPMLAAFVDNSMDLLLNLTLLVALSILSGFIEKRWPSTTRTGTVWQGALFAVTTLFGMFKPLTLGPGVIFDGRSVMISLCALFFGPLAVAIAGLPAMLYRLAIGGPGMYMGVLTVISAGAIGLWTRYRFKPLDNPPSTTQLYLFGLGVHAAMLAGAATFPLASGLAVLRSIGAPVMVLYPLATVLAGKILADQVMSHRMLRALEDSEERFKLSMEATSDGLWDLHVRSDEAYYNPAYYRILGFEPGEFPTTGAAWRSLVHPDDLPRALEADRLCIEGGQDLLEVEYRMRARNGDWRWIYARGKCVERDAQGRGTRLVGTHVDMTDRRTTEEQLKRNLAEKEVLLREVHHRVKNNLNIISSLLNLQSSMIRSPADAMSAFENSRDRIMAMSLVHEKLYQSANYAQVNMHEYVGTLASQLMVAYGQGRPIRLSFDAAGVFLDVNASIPCGLIMNEIMTNAFKYAFPDNREGAISIRLRRSAQGMVELHLADDGIGMPADVVVERADSLGLTLVRLLVEQLGGTMRVDRGHGTSFLIQFPEAS